MAAAMELQIIKAVVVVEEGLLRPEAMLQIQTAQPVELKEEDLREQELPPLITDSRVFRAVVVEVGDTQEEALPETEEGQFPAAVEEAQDLATQPVKGVGRISAVAVAAVVDSQEDLGVSQ